MRNTPFSVYGAALARCGAAVTTAAFCLLSALLQPALAADLPTIGLHELPQNLQEIYALNRPELGKNGHCAAAFDSRTDGMKMAISCAIFVRLSAQGERKSVELCTERAKFLKVKAPCKLIVE